MKLKHYIDPSKMSIKELKKTIEESDEIKFISLCGVDLGNHSTDERIPKEYILDDFEGFLENGIQTDGSSVYLPIIAELNNAKVDIIPDKEVKWFVDYNTNSLDENSLPKGTLDIPSFLRHSNNFVGSRAVLKRATEYVKKEVLKYLEADHALDDLPIKSTKDIKDVVLTSATELEFWVKTPDHRSDIEKLNASQELKEHYWKRTVGQVRTAMENALEALNASGMVAEMAHKEVGGVKSKLTGTNLYTGIMEQLEIDWEYDYALQSADNELYAKNIIKDTFESQGLDVTFKAKPIENVAGSGEHTHISISLLTKKGDYINLFSHKDHENHFMSKFGWGALYGMIHNYDIINPFVTATTDGFKRLKPGFEAPVCTVASIGRSPQMPSRNRTVLAGLIRDIKSPMATRFELRAPNPNTNTYLALSALYLCIIDGIKYVVENNKNSEELHTNFLKDTGEEKFYLDTNRLYCTEKDVFDSFTRAERDALFGKPPSTVYENLKQLEDNDKINILLDGDVFKKDLIASYKKSMEEQWKNEMIFRLRENVLKVVRRYKKAHQEDDVVDLDIVNWEKVNNLRYELAKDTMAKKSLLTNLLEAIESDKLDEASKYQLEIDEKLKALHVEFNNYKNNLINI